MRQNEGRTTKHTHTPSTTAGQLSRHSCNQIPRGRYQRENWARAPHGTNRGGRGGNNRQGGEPTRANHQARKSGALPNPQRSTTGTAKTKRHTDRSKRQENQEPKRAKPQRERKTTKGTEDFFFSSSVADVALKARSLHEHKQKRYLYKDISCPMGQANRLKQHTTTKTNQHDDPQIPQPDLRFASGKTKQTAKAKNSRKRGQSPTRTPTKSICHETQWLVHCITRKSVPNELISRLSGKHEG